MKHFLLSIISLTLMLFSTIKISAQNPWQYVGEIKFPDPDSTVFPLLGTLDDEMRLWVISSKAQAPRARNAVYYADFGDTVFTKFIDFDENGDSDTLAGNIGALRGIASLDKDLFLSFTIPYPKYSPNTVSGMYVYSNMDTNQVFKIGYQIGISGTGGYGSFNHGIDITPDSIIFAGISFGTTFRVFNFSNSMKYSVVSPYGFWIPGNPSNPGENNFSNQTEPGGLESQGKDLPRDVALVPGMDYTNSDSYFFTSRNSLAIDQLTGGIAIWQGGTTLSALQYSPARVEDFDGYLALIDLWPCGIDVDVNGILWVAGIDSTRRWVKGFELDGINAEAVYDLPSSNSMDFADPSGAPMGGPSDVVLSSDAGYAFVIDAYAKRAWVFDNLTVGVNEEKLLRDFDLEQNYPNPFNPSTRIKFTLAKDSNVKLVVTDILGREVAALVNERLGAGQHTHIFNASKLSSGVYLYTLSAGGVRLSRKMLLVK